MHSTNKINLITVDGYFGQSLPTHVSLNVEYLKCKFENRGFSVNIIDIQDIQNYPINNDVFYIVGSHQNPEVKKYIDDVLAILFQGEKEKNLIPGRLNILAHENKGVQALIAKTLGEYYFPAQSYYYDLIALEKKVVVKKTEGAGSSGVELAANTESLEKVVKKFSLLDYRLNDIIFIIKNFSKKYFFKNKYSDGFTKYHKKYTRFCLQEFYENLTCDYKVLVFGNTIYVLKRDVRDDSFKASGSGKFSYPEQDNDLLDFSHELCLALNTPYVSLDVVRLPSGQYKCIEFQCAHFGPYTMLNAPFKYTKNDQGRWESLPNDLTLEDAYAQSIIYYIDSFQFKDYGFKQ